LSIINSFVDFLVPCGATCWDVSRETICCGFYGLNYFEVPGGVTRHIHFGSLSFDSVLMKIEKANNKDMGIEEEEESYAL
jgi:hypothetical protein